MLAASESTCSAVGETVLATSDRTFFSVVSLMVMTALGSSGGLLSMTIE